MKCRYHKGKYCSKECNNFRTKYKFDCDCKYNWEMSVNKRIEKQLMREFDESGQDDFREFLINKIEVEHNRSVQMAGDLGSAFSEISELKAKLYGKNLLDEKGK